MAELSSWAKARQARRERENLERREDAQRQEDMAFRQQGVDLQRQALEEQRRATQASEVFAGRQFDAQEKARQEAAARDIFGFQAQGLAAPATAGEPGVFDLGGGVPVRPTTPSERAKTMLDIDLETDKAKRGAAEQAVNDFLDKYGEDYNDYTVKSIRAAALTGHSLPQDTIPGIYAQALRDQLNPDPAIKARGNAAINAVIRLQQAGSYTMSPTAGFNIGAEAAASEWLRQAMTELGPDADPEDLFNKATELAVKSGRSDAVQGLTNLRSIIGTRRPFNLQQAIEEVVGRPIVEGMRRSASGQGTPAQTPTQQPQQPMIPSPERAPAEPAATPTAAPPSPATPPSQPGLDPFDFFRMLFGAAWQKPKTP